MEKIVNDFEQLVLQTRLWQETPDKPVPAMEILAFRNKLFTAGEALKKLMKGPEPEEIRKKQMQRWHDLSTEFNKNIIASWSKAKGRLESGMYENVFGNSKTSLLIFLKLIHTLSSLLTIIGIQKDEIMSRLLEVIYITITSIQLMTSTFICLVYPAIDSKIGIDKVSIQVLNKLHQSSTIDQIGDF